MSFLSLSPRRVLPSHGDLQDDEHDQGHERHVVPDAQRRREDGVHRATEGRHRVEHVVPELDPVEHRQQVNLVSGSAVRWHGWWWWWWWSTYNVVVVVGTHVASLT